MRLFDADGNIFDSAPIYGGGASERLLGEWVEAPGNRDEVVLITKGGHPTTRRPRITQKDITEDPEQPLDNLRTDHIDLYFLHRNDPQVPVGVIIEWLNTHMGTGAHPCHRRLKLDAGTT